jgi:hypothetical protein
LVLDVEPPPRTLAEAMASPDDERGLSVILMETGINAGPVEVEFEVLPSEPGEPSGDAGDAGPNWEDVWEDLDLLLPEGAAYLHGPGEADVLDLGTIEKPGKYVGHAVADGDLFGFRHGVILCGCATFRREDCWMPRLAAPHDEYRETQQMVLSRSRRSGEVRRLAQFLEEIQCLIQDQGDPADVLHQVTDRRRPEFGPVTRFRFVGLGDGVRIAQLHLPEQRVGVAAGCAPVEQHPGFKIGIWMAAEDMAGGLFHHFCQVDAGCGLPGH